MKKFIYVRCEVRKPEPGQVGILNTILERATGVAVPDVVPQVFAGSMSFRHVFLSAIDADSAYDVAHCENLLPELEPDVICMNDYVAEIQL